MLFFVLLVVLNAVLVCSSGVKIDPKSRSFVDSYGRCTHLLIRLTDWFGWLIGLLCTTFSGL
jgi:hypothetical protein